MENGAINGNVAQAADEKTDEFHPHETNDVVSRVDFERTPPAIITSDEGSWSVWTP